MATPMRVLYSSDPQVPATATATANTMIWWYVTAIPATSIDLPRKKSGRLAMTSLGGQMIVASWIRATSRPMGTTMRMVGARVVQPAHEAPGR
jgi:hypothetical protein